MLQFGNVSPRRESLVIFVGMGGPIFRVRVPFIVLQAKPSCQGSLLRGILRLVRQRLAGIFAELVRFGGRIRRGHVFRPLCRNGNVQIDERLPARGIFYPDMREALIVVNAQYALDLAEQVNGSHVQCAFVVGSELSQIIEDLRLGMDPAVRLDPLEALIQESGGGFLVATREGLGQIVVRLAERRRVIGSGKWPARKQNQHRTEQNSGGERACEETSHRNCLLDNEMNIGASFLIWRAHSFKSATNPTPSAK